MPHQAVNGLRYVRDNIPRSVVTVGSGIIRHSRFPPRASLGRSPRRRSRES